VIPSRAVKRFAPAADRNKGPILEVLREVLPPDGMVLEIASGSGQHAAFLASALPQYEWQPTEADSQTFESIIEYVRDADLSNLRPPLLLDTRSEVWPIEHASAVLCINMIHIAPWSACVGLLRGSAHILPSGGPLILYGPFCIHGDYTAPSNVEFDRALHAQNDEWGVRELDDVAGAAREFGLKLDRIVPRPANNHVIVLRK
jgi:hypothetical protein